MKTQLLLFLTVILSTGCSPKVGQELKGSTIMYQALSRGFYLNIEIQGSKITVSRNREEAGNEFVLTDSQRSDFEKLYQRINLEAIKDYKAPTEKRFHDGAAIANLTVNYQDKIYNSQPFDHGNPPVEIAEFINKIVSFTEN